MRKKKKKNTKKVKNIKMEKQKNCWSKSRTEGYQKKYQP